MAVVAVIADTHLPRGARRLPDECVRRLAAAEAILHAGDLVASAVLEELRGFGVARRTRFTATPTSWTLRETLPTSLVVEVGGARIGMTHIARAEDGPGGAARGTLPRLRRGRLRPHARAAGRAASAASGSSIRAARPRNAGRPSRSMLVLELDARRDSPRARGSHLTNRRSPGTLANTCSFGSS